MLKYSFQLICQVVQVYVQLVTVQILTKLLVPRLMVSNVELTLMFSHDVLIYQNSSDS